MVHRMLLLIGALIAGPAGAGEPILVPEFSASSGDDYVVTIMINEQVNARLLQDGHMLLTTDVVSRALPPGTLANCMAQPQCPSQALSQLPSRVAVVVRIDRSGPTMVAHMEVWERGQGSASSVQDVPIAPGNEHMFAAAVSTAVSVAIARAGTATEAELVTASRLVSGQPVTLGAAPPAQPPPVAPPPPSAQPVPPTQPPPAAGTPPTPRPVAKGRIDFDAPLEEQLEGTGVLRRHLVGAEPNYRKARTDPRDWVYRTMPHAGRFLIEVSAGIGMGDVDRGADLRTELEGGTESLQWFQEYPVVSRRPRGAMYLGYAPATFVDVGLWGGLQYGRRVFSTGVTRVRTNGPQHTIGDPTDVAAVTLLLQPRVRGYLVHLGPVKPYVFTGAEIKVFDGYALNQPDGYTFVLPPGAAVPGWVGGGGMMIDPSPIVGFFFEASYVRHFGPRAVLYPFGTWPYEIPAVELPSEQTVGLVGGVQFRI